MARTKYLNNRDLMAEIHKSKNSYNSYIDDKYSMYDCIVYDLEHITSDIIKQSQIDKADRIVKVKKHENKKVGVKETIEKLDPETMIIDELVFRVMDHLHVPIDPIKEAKEIERAKEKAEELEKAKTKAKQEKKEWKEPEPLTSSQHFDLHLKRREKTKFKPFKHYVLKSYEYVNDEYTNLAFKEVGKSHWEGGMGNGHYNNERGNITPALAHMFMKLTERYALRGNWRGYTYNDEMQSQALLQLSQVGLQFDEAKSSNPFSYYTETINNSFTRVLNVEKKNQLIRDDLLIAHGSSPSFTRQIEHEKAMKEEEMRAGWAQPLPKVVKRGRKKASDIELEKAKEKANEE